jgi:hypothetical protein
VSLANIRDISFDNNGWEAPSSSLNVSVTSSCRRYRCPSDDGMHISHMANMHFDFEQELQRHSTRTSQIFTGQRHHYLQFILHD